MHAAEDDSGFCTTACRISNACRSRAHLALALVFILGLFPSTGFAVNFTMKKLELELTVHKSGEISVSQIYEWPPKGRPTTMETDVPSSVSTGLFYKPLGISHLRTYAAGGIEKMPIKSSHTVRSKSIRVGLEHMYKFEGMGPAVTIDYLLETPYRSGSFSGTFFGTDDFPGAVSVENVELTVRWEGEAKDVEQILFRVYEGRNEIQMRLAQTQDGLRKFRVPKRLVDLPLKLEIDRLAVSSKFLTGATGTPWMGYVRENLWLSLPLGFLFLLYILALALAKTDTNPLHRYQPRLRPPSGMDPGMAAVLLCGGFTSRAFGAMVLWLAHRGRVTLEYRPESNNPMMGLLVSKRTDPDSSFRDYERLLWNNVLFQGVESMSIGRIKGELNKAARRHVLRAQLNKLFPRRVPLLRPQAREWWLWPMQYQALLMGILLFGAYLLSAGIGITETDIAKTEWLVTWPIMIAGFAAFMVKASWHRMPTVEQEDTELLEFMSFLHGSADGHNAGLRGNTAGFSLLFPYAVATGTEEKLLDAYCHDAKSVALPAWFMIYGTADEDVHVNVFREFMCDFVDGLLRAI